METSPISQISSGGEGTQSPFSILIRPIQSAHEADAIFFCYSGDLLFQLVAFRGELTKAGGLDHRPTDAFLPALLQHAWHRVSRGQDHCQIDMVGDVSHGAVNSAGLDRPPAGADRIDDAAEPIFDQVADNVAAQVIRIGGNTNNDDAAWIEKLA
jgi:hypothetical protein